ncbi:hypothetical protein HI806_09525 [Ralstonia solanacearum]|nr:hypothetical protein HI806_09525 [Ralstonia solanacearum]QKL76713.1 hypothetical protein HI805_09535 [Ralstonia solanacearum]QKL81917.1 hypothetical protein HI804_09535 [Ralstonia solanacearum]QKL87128.1 hypothetical protein HI803_09540 [Ralstonia solanacearum]QKM02494.1 hypothetical protein HI800_09535 [Ralstonia solanacearum]
MAAFGLTLADIQPEPPDIWPENATTVEVFAHLGTQWRIGARGPIGLEYAAIPVVLMLLRVPPHEHADVFAGIRIMEHAALAQMNGE